MRLHLPGTDYGMRLSSTVLHRGGSRIDGRGVLRLHCACERAKWFLPRPLITSFFAQRHFRTHATVISYTKIGAKYVYHPCAIPEVVRAGTSISESPLSLGSILDVLK